MDDSLESEQQIPPLFYFKYPMRLEFIPFIQQEVVEFLHFGADLLKKGQDPRHFLRILNKRAKEIQRFYHRNWNDYRASQMMRAREKLVGFCQENHRLIARQLRQQEGEGNRGDVSASRHNDETINRTDIALSPEVRERDNSKESVRTDRKKERIRTESSQNSQEYSPIINENIPALILKEPPQAPPKSRQPQSNHWKVSPQPHQAHPQPHHQAPHLHPQHHSKPDSPKMPQHSSKSKTPSPKVSPGAKNKPNKTTHTTSRQQTHHKPMATMQVPPHTAPQNRGKSLLQKLSELAIVDKEENEPPKSPRPSPRTQRNHTQKKEAPRQRKMTKEQYIAYLRAKKA